MWCRGVDLLIPVVLWSVLPNLQTCPLSLLSILRLACLAGGPRYLAIINHCHHQHSHVEQWKSFRSGLTVALSLNIKLFLKLCSMKHIWYILYTQWIQCYTSWVLHDYKGKRQTNISQLQQISFLKISLFSSITCFPSSSVSVCKIFRRSPNEQGTSLLGLPDMARGPDIHKNSEDRTSMHWYWLFVLIIFAQTPGVATFIVL